MNFVFAGSQKNGYEKVASLIKKYNLQDQFFILGYVNNDEMVSLYKKAQALVFPSFFGPTNIPPLEALALGCNVIISDVYANKEQLGEKCFYFEPKDTKDLMQKIEVVLTLRTRQKNPKNNDSIFIDNEKYTLPEIINNVLSKILV